MFRLYHWEWAGLTLYGFGLAAATGFALLWVALTLTRRRFGAASGTATWLMVLGIPLGLFMGRVVFCLLQPGAVFFDPIDGTYLGLWPLLRIWQGGLNAFGLMAGLAAAVLLTAVITHQSKTTLFDWVAAPAALLLSVLCFGLILAGEGYGSVLDKPNPLPGMVNDYGEWYLAVYLLEGVVYALIAVILSAMKNPRPGGRALGLLSLTGCAQLFLSSLRRDNYARLEINGFIRADQLLALCTLVGVVAYLALSGKTRRMAGVWLALLAAVVFAALAEFYEKLPAPTWLLYLLSGVSVSILSMVLYRRAAEHPREELLDRSAPR